MQTSLLSASMSNEHATGPVFEDDPAPSCCDGVLSLVGGFFKLIIMFIVIPIFFAFAMLGFVFWLLFTIFGGAIGHCIHQADDEVLLEKQIKSESNPGGAVQLMKMPKTGNVLAVRWSPGGRRAYPVCIPNGLGATLVTISRLHELLVDMGFSVLSYVC